MKIEIKDNAGRRPPGRRPPWRRPPWSRPSDKTTDNQSISIFEGISTMNTKHTRESLHEIFSHNKKVLVHFIKKNGVKRRMVCSLHADLLPESPKKDGEERTSSRPPSETSFPVFDLEKQAWRAFTVANIISIEGVDE